MTSSSSPVPGTTLEVSMNEINPMQWDVTGRETVPERGPVWKESSQFSFRTHTLTPTRAALNHAGVSGGRVEVKTGEQFDVRATTHAHIHTRTRTRTDACTLSRPRG